MSHTIRHPVSSFSFKAILQSPHARFVIALFLLWRVGLFAVAFFSRRFLSFDPAFPYADTLLIPTNLPQWMWGFGNFDGVHYLTIAMRGYAAQFTQVFFPLYPLIMRVLALPLGSELIAGLVIANAGFAATLFVFAKLLQMDGYAQDIRWILLFVVVVPFSFFFGSLYTEGLFMMLVFASFLAARKKRWFWAGVLGGLASSTRIFGIFLLPALLWEHYKNNSNFKFIFQSPITYLIPAGLVSYMFYLQWKFNDALYFWHAQPVFGAQRAGSSIVLPPQVLWRYGKIITSVPIGQYNFWVAVWEAAAYVVAIALLLIAHRNRVRLSYLIFSWFVIIIPSLTGTLSSMPRYILLAFPLYIVLGSTKRLVVRYILLGVFLLLLVLFTALFIQGRWVA